MQEEGKLKWMRNDKIVGSETHSSKRKGKGVEGETMMFKGDLLPFWTLRGSPQSHPHKQLSCTFLQALLAIRAPASLTRAKRWDGEYTRTRYRDWHATKEL